MLKDKIRAPKYHCSRSYGSNGSAAAYHKRIRAPKHYRGSYHNDMMLGIGIPEG